MNGIFSKVKIMFKVIAGLAFFVWLGYLTMFVISSCVYNRSVSATVVASYIKAIDRNAMFEDEDLCIQVMEEKKEENLKDIPLPETELSVNNGHIDKMQYIEINKEASENAVILYFPGGAFVNQPTQEHFNFIEKLSSETKLPVTVGVYLKATNYTCDEAYEEAMKLYEKYAEDEKIGRIILAGDSSGGNFALSLAMQLREKDILQPDKLILLSPWLDLSMENPEMKNYVQTDIMLGIPGLEAIGKVWAGKRTLYDPVVSPLYGSFRNLSEILCIGGTEEIFYPDFLAFEDRLKTDEANYILYIEKGMNHVYPLFPISEAKTALEKIVAFIGK